MKIKLPHLNYTVHVLQFKKSPNGMRAKAYTKKGKDNHSCAVYLPKRTQPGTVAHELVHVLRYICEDRNMDFQLEEEHMAYTMQYLLNEILGYEYA